MNVNGNTFECEREAVHLGHRVSTQDIDSLVKSAINGFWRGFNLFTAKFGHTYGFVKCKLFKQYYCSYYGSHLWTLNGKGFNLCVQHIGRHCECGGYIL